MKSMSHGEKEIKETLSSMIIPLYSSFVENDDEEEVVKLNPFLSMDYRGLRKAPRSGQRLKNGLGLLIGLCISLPIPPTTLKTPFHNYLYP